MTDNKAFADRIARLSPEQRAVLEQRLAQRGAPASSETIPARPPERSAPLSYSQERLWFLSQLEPENYAFNRPFAFRLRGPLDLGALRRAINSIIERHEILRTVYPSEVGQPRQVVLPAQELPMPAREVGRSATRSPEDELQDFLQAESHRQFDLARGPILHTSLFRLAADDHVLFVNVHHIAFDGWSASVWLSEMSRLYQAFAAGEPGVLEDLPVQYADYAAWARERFGEQTLEPQLAYWRQNLRAPLARLDLPFDHARQSAQTHRGAHRDLLLSAELTTRVAGECRRRKITPFVLLLGAYCALLHRYTGQTDIVIGSPTANRDRPETERLIGFFVNTLVLRTHVDGVQSFEDLLATLRTTVLGAQANADVPFEVLVADLQPQRDLRFPPLFQVLFNYENLGAAEVARTVDLTIREHDFQSGIAQFDLGVEITPAAGGLRCRFDYNTDLFDDNTIARMMGHYATLLAAALDRPGESIAALDLIAPEEMQLLLEHWTQTGAPYSEQETVIDLFEACAAKHPRRTALLQGDTAISYSELNERANRLAHLLQSLGLTADQRVAVYLERSIESVEAMLAVLKAGGVLLLLDPAYPAEVIRHAVEDARAGMLVTRAALLERLEEFGGVTVCLDELGGRLETREKRNPGVRRPLESLAYIIYTSGTTGWPKGIAIPHRQLAIGMAWLGQAHPFNEEDVGCHRAPLGFQDALWEVFAALTQGGPLVVVAEAEAGEPRRLVEVLARHRVTRLIAVPALIRALLDLVPDLAARVPHLTFWIATGETLSGDLYRRFIQRMPHTRLYNFYGTAEAGDVAWYTPDPHYDHMLRCPIGRPISNVRTYILDETRRPVPIGILGELYVASSGLAHGYLNNPDLTAERFLRCPFGQQPDARMYRTGDLARFLPTGDIDLVGRVDQQVKLNGMRIEPEQVEAVLEEHPMVEGAWVDVRADPSGDRRLVAYVVGRAGPESLLAFIRPRLPRYMVPQLFVHLDSLPRTPTGKVDRHALPDPDWALRTATRRAVQPRNEVERRLAAIWSELLGVAEVGVEDDFFEIGGHSLLAARLMARVEREFGTSLPLALLFEHSTIAGIADALRAKEEPPGWNPLVPIQAGGEHAPLFVVHGMLGNVLHLRHLAQALGPDQPFYGLQARGLDGLETPQDRVEDMASDYLRAIRRVQPHGPYFLGGYSFGGLVAFEMSRQLTAQGEQVAALVLFDTKLVRPPQPAAARRSLVIALRREIRALPRTLEYIRGLPLRQRLSFLRRKVEVFSGTKLGVRLSHHRLPRLPRNLPPSSLPVLQACRRAMRHYTPRAYPGSAILVLPDLQPDYSVRTDERKVADWSALVAGGLDVVRVGGSKGTMIAPPKVTALARQLAERLERARVTFSGT